MCVKPHMVNGPTKIGNLVAIPTNENCNVTQDGWDIAAVDRQIRSVVELGYGQKTHARLQNEQMRRGV